MRNGEMTEGRKGGERKGCESYAAAVVVVKVFFGSTRLDGLRALGRTVTDLDGRRGGKNFKTRSLSFPGHRLRREGETTARGFFSPPLLFELYGKRLRCETGIHPFRCGEGVRVKKVAN